VPAVRRVVADVNEPEAIVEEIKSLGVRVDRRRLEPCDYIAGGTCVERKTVRDLLRSVYDGRLFDQLERMRESHERYVVLVELRGVLGLSEREEKVFVGALAAAVRSGASVVAVPGRRGSARFIASLAKEGGEIVVGRRKPKLSDINEVLIYVLTGFPGIGPKSAEALLTKFKTLRRIFNASIPELRSVVGEKKAWKIREVLDARFERARGRAELPSSETV